MKITITVEDPSADILSLLLASSEKTFQPSQATLPPKSVSVDYVATTVKPRDVDFAEDTPALTITDPEPEAKFSKADALVASLDKQFKRAKTVTLKAGVQGVEGDYVDTEDGREGLIVAVYRGRAVVLFDDGSAVELGASTLTKVSEGIEPVPAPVPEPVTPRRRRGAAVEPDPAVDPEEAEVLSLTAGLEKGVLLSILKEFDMKSLTEFAELEGEDRTDFIEIVREAAAE